MNEANALNYVKASAAALDLPLSAERMQRVAGHLQRTAQMAQLLQDMTMDPEDELAEIFRPAPFPTAQPGRDPS